MIVYSHEPVLAEDFQPGVSCCISEVKYARVVKKGALEVTNLTSDWTRLLQKGTQGPSQQLALSDNIIAVMCGYMEFYLPETWKPVLDSWLGCVVGTDAFPVRLQGLQEISAICGQLSSAGNS